MSSRFTSIFLDSDSSDIAVRNTAHVLLPMVFVFTIASLIFVISILATQHDSGFVVLATMKSLVMGGIIFVAAAVIATVFESYILRVMNSFVFGVMLAVFLVLVSL